MLGPWRRPTGQWDSRRRAHGHDAAKDGDRAPCPPAPCHASTARPSRTVRAWVAFMSRGRTAGMMPRGEQDTRVRSHRARPLARCETESAAIRKSECQLLAKLEPPFCALSVTIGPTQWR